MMTKKIFIFFYSFYFHRLEIKLKQYCKHRFMLKFYSHPIKDVLDLCPYTVFFYVNTFFFFFWRKYINITYNKQIYSGNRRRSYISVPSTVLRPYVVGCGTNFCVHRGSSRHYVTSWLIDTKLSTILSVF